MRWWWGVLVFFFALFAIRLFYLQVIRHDYYKEAALSDQMKQYEIPATRGIITAQLGDKAVPLVLNQKLYTLYADPTVVDDAEKSAAKLQPIIGGNVDDIEKLLKSKNTRYVILGKKLTLAQQKRILALKLKGIGTQEQDYRTYPQGTLASQVLGFVNDDGQGVYGIEQALNKQLSGVPGELKAVTDINGVPLATNADNVLLSPIKGNDVELTINLGMQANLENILKDAQAQYLSKDVSAVVLDVDTGEVKAMANYPTYDPANYQQVEDASLFNNMTVTEPIEPGSITKLFTTAAALEKGAITPTSSFYDPGQWNINGGMVVDVAEDHSQGQQTVLSVLDKSLNTGATWMLMQIGGGQINAGARGILYDYFTKHFGLGSPTGIEQGNGEEAAGVVHKPDDNGANINFTYANMSYGQAYTATAIQMISGFASLVNGGTYYQPHLVAQTTSADGKVTTVKPKVVRANTISKQVSDDIVSLLEQNNTNHIKEGFPYLDFGPNYNVGGKTGTAEIYDPQTGGYSNTVNNGTYLGFVGGDTPQYAIVVYNLQPQKYNGFAGAGTGQTVFANIAHMLINNFGVTPKKN